LRAALEVRAWFDQPSPAVQWVLPGVLDPLAYLLGYRAIDPSYCKPQVHITPTPKSSLQQVFRQPDLGVAGTLIAYRIG
jgi:hypothetical protein